MAEVSRALMWGSISYFSLCAVAAVHDGYLLTKSIVKGPIGSQLLSKCMLQSAQAKGTTVRPAYSFKRLQNAAGQWEVRGAPLPCMRALAWERRGQDLLWL